MRQRISRRALMIVSSIVLVAGCLYGAASVVYYCLFFGAGLEGKERFKALDVARPSAPYLSDLIRLFPNARVNYRYFARSGDPGFDVSADLYERYEFGMQLPVLFDSTHRHVIGYGNPKFYLWEAAKIERREGRAGGVSITGGTNFGAAEWQKIVEKDGDFGAIGF